MPQRSEQQERGHFDIPLGRPFSFLQFFRAISPQTFRKGGRGWHFSPKMFSSTNFGDLKTWKCYNTVQYWRGSRIGRAFLFNWLTQGLFKYQFVRTSFVEQSFRKYFCRWTLFSNIFLSMNNLFEHISVDEQSFRTYFCRWTIFSNIFLSN
jgi:hypothetical protein